MIIVINHYLHLYHLYRQPVSTTDDTNQMGVMADALLEELVRIFPYSSRIGSSDKTRSMWCCEKPHSMTHFGDNVEQVGHSKNISAQVNESTHKPVKVKIWQPTLLHQHYHAVADRLSLERISINKEWGNWFRTPFLAHHKPRYIDPISANAGVPLAILADAVTGARLQLTLMHQSQVPKKTAYSDLPSGPQHLWGAGRHVVKSDSA
jgi:hypothetical protein